MILNRGLIIWGVTMLRTKLEVVVEVYDGSPCRFKECDDVLVCKALDDSIVRGFFHRSEAVQYIEEYICSTSRYLETGDLMVSLTELETDLSESKHALTCTNFIKAEAKND